MPHTWVISVGLIKSYICILFINNLSEISLSTQLKQRYKFTFIRKNTTRLRCYSIICLVLIKQKLQSCHMRADTENLVQVDSASFIQLALCE